MKTDIVESLDDPDSYEFTVGQWYLRGALHDAYRGNRQKGISSPKDHPVVFVFVGEPGERYGYDDEFKEDGTLLYTGVGQAGDQTMDGMNERLKNHEGYGDDVHVFEEVRENPASVVTYVGEYELEDVWPTQMKDENEEHRRAFRYELKPVENESDGPTIDDDASIEDVFRSAKRSSTNSGGGTTSSTSRSRSNSSGPSRSERVRQFALKHADGVCQGCEDEAPFETPDGDPFLEVHHLYRLTDGGADVPENVIALCPNCHRRRHRGKDGDEFNQDLIEKAEKRNDRVKERL